MTPELKTPHLQTAQLKTAVRRVARYIALRSGWGARRDVRLVLRAAEAALSSVEDAAGEPPAVLVAPPGGGNVGDQAMVEAFLAATAGEVVIVTSAADSIVVPRDRASTVSIMCLPHLLYGERGMRRDALDEFGRVLGRARSVAVIGADIMDGFYNPRASVRRSVVAEAAARAGVETRVIGFSWPGRPHPAARDQLAAAVRAGALALPRDPASDRRLTADGIRPHALAADIVFTTSDTNDSLRRALPLTGRYAVVNVSGHLSRGIDLEADYVRIVAALRERGLEVVMLPHVATDAADDRMPCARVAARFDRGVHLVDRVPTPAEVRGLTSAAELTVTGRMHLAIMSFLFGVPAIALASQGKVEGLMESLGVPQLCVEPVAGIADRVIALADESIPPDSPVRRAIAAALPAVRARAFLNVPVLAEESA